MRKSSPRQADGSSINSSALERFPFQPIDRVPARLPIRALLLMLDTLSVSMRVVPASAWPPPPPGGSAGRALTKTLTFRASWALCERRSLASDDKSDFCNARCLCDCRGKRTGWTARTCWPRSSLCPRVALYSFVTLSSRRTCRRTPVSTARPASPSRRVRRNTHLECRRRPWRPKCQEYLVRL